MIRVVLSGNLRKFTGGETEVELEAGNVRQLFRALGERYPALKLSPLSATGRSAGVVLLPADSRPSPGRLPHRPR